MDEQKIAHIKRKLNKSIPVGFDIKSESDFAVF